MIVPVWLLVAAGIGLIALIGLSVAAIAGRQAASKALRASEAAMASAQSSLADAQERLASVLEGCGAGVLIVDGALQIAFANSDVARWLGHSRTEIEGKDLVGAVFSDELAKAVRGALDDGEPRALELKEIGPDKRSFFVSVVSRKGAGEAYVFAQDVTEVRRLERVRQDFVANVSHELRTPLASIRAMSETLESGAVEGSRTAKRFLRTIVSEADRLRRIADDLLVLSRAESVEPERAPFNLSELLQEVFARFKMAARREKIELTQEVPPGLVLHANRDQIEEAVVNLVDNALKYTAAEGRVLLAAEAGDEAIRISVSDTGIGIMQEDVPRVFERFYRVDRARSRQTGGTGLGLAIVKHITESHGGRVLVDTEFNRGSKFSLVFPVNANEAGGSNE